jgi:hypothetical protein
MVRHQQPPKHGREVADVELVMEIDGSLAVETNYAIVQLEGGLQCTCG